MVITFIPWKLYNGTIKKALGWSSIKTTLCLLFNMGDKVATRTTQKTEEADKIEPHRLDRTQSGGAVWWIKDLACPSLAALWIINTVKQNPDRKIKTLRINHKNTIIYLKNGETFAVNFTKKKGRNIITL